MPRIQFARLYQLAARSARTTFARPDCPDMSKPMAGGSPLYRYVGYRSNMPQAQAAGRTQFLTLQSDLNNRWTGSDLGTGGRQGLYFSAEFLPKGAPFPELNHYQDPSNVDSTGLVSYYEYTPGLAEPIAPGLRVVDATNLRSTFLSTLKAGQTGIDLRLLPDGANTNPLLRAIHAQMMVDSEYASVRAEAIGVVDIENLESMYGHPESADFCRAVGNVALEQPNVQHLLVTSVRDGLSTNIVASTPTRNVGDPPAVLDTVEVQGRATFFVSGGAVGQGVFTVADMLYNATFESPTDPPAELPPVEMFTAQLIEAQKGTVDALADRLAQSLANQPSSPAMDGVVTALEDVKARLAARDVVGASTAIEGVNTALNAAVADDSTARAFKGALALSEGVAGSLSAMSKAIEAAQERADGREAVEPESIDDPKPEDIDPSSAGPPIVNE